ncbi:MAG: hypothetical protein HQL33_06290, partial [Alphaproteobacteria bacterium]|nr:hypothetical protein [Alphaproteobacteria bacterium]
MRGTGVGFMTVAGLLALGACAPAAARWAKAGVGESEMRADLSACRHTADRDVAPAYDR